MKREYCAWKTIYLNNPLMSHFFLNWQYVDRLIYKDRAFLQPLDACDFNFGQFSLTFYILPSILYMNISKDMNLSCRRKGQNVMCLNVIKCEKEEAWAVYKMMKNSSFVFLVSPIIKVNQSEDRPIKCSRNLHYELELKKRNNPWVKFNLQIWLKKL